MIMKLFSSLLIMLLPFSAGAESIYFSQSGTGDGTSCCSPRSVSWFNTAANWDIDASADGKIGPNDDVYMCGTITGNLAFQGNGSATLGWIDLFGAAPFEMQGNITVADKTHFYIGSVNFKNGHTGAPLVISGASGPGMLGWSTIDNFAGQYAVRIDQSGFVGGRPNGITITSNYIRTATTNFGDTQHDIIVSSGGTNVVIENNHLEMRVVGASPSTFSHDDVLQTFTKGGSNDGPPQDWTIRYNKIVMNTTGPSTDHRSWCILENLGGTNFIYSNLFLGLDGADGSNGCALFNQAAGTVNHIVGNTFVSKVGASNNVLNLQGSGVMNLRGNIFYTAASQSYTLSATTINRADNLWFGTNAPCCTPSPNSNGEYKADPLFNNFANNDFSLTATSPASNIVDNLGSPYNTALAPTATWSNPPTQPNPALVPRPSSGRVEAGAFEIP